MISCALSLQSRSLRYPRGNQMPNSSLTIFARFCTYCVSVMSPRSRKSLACVSFGILASGVGTTGGARGGAGASGRTAVGNAVDGPDRVGAGGEP